MPGHHDPTSDDFVCVATLDSPTEAHLLKGVLEAVHLTPHLADEHMVRNYSLLAPALGGVRVLVPASEVAAAHRAIEEFESGAYRLDDDPDEDPAARR
ncbi:putative signal transducing protein [Roseateles chitinivorans]|uniref:putative signal transducing protein n=1 Tax=Roseateles chitinivorans TaxID=2917965 RepID=UPI003D669698